MSRRLLPAVLVLGASLGVLLVAVLSAIVLVPELRPTGLVGLALVVAMILLVRRGGRHQEPAPPVLDSRRWVPGRRSLV